MFVDDSRSGLVLHAIQRTIPLYLLAGSPQDMALITSCAVLLAVFLFAVITAAFGHRMMRILRLEFPSHVEHLLCSVALGVISFEVLIFFVQTLGHIRIGTAAVILLLVVVGIPDLSPVLVKLSLFLGRCLSGSGFERGLIAVAGLVLLVDGFAAMAPLTGSDALQYHFTAPSLVLRAGFHPDFFLSNGFLCGQSHLLILAGLALGSDQLAMGFLFLGGVLTTATCVCLARRWISKTWSLAAGLAFLLTPVVFWQISTAGAPDLWMAFFATLAVLVISRSSELPSWSRAVLAGTLAGAIAGAKYTGLIVAASIFVAQVVEVRAIRSSLLFVFAALSTGVWPYARNFAWTGDPMFPFLTRWLSPEKVNTYALTSFLANTGAGEHRGVPQVLELPFFAAIDPLHLGFWQYLGPLVIAFAGTLFLVVRATPTWRAALSIWGFSAFGIGVSSGMMRYLLPVFPIALAAAFAGVVELSPAGWRLSHYLALATICSSLFFGGSGLVFYERSALSAAVGLTSRENYLTNNCPEYRESQYINQVLMNRGSKGRALVFLRHTYYLRVPFLSGDPQTSWAIDPSRLQSPEAWQEFFHQKNIRWVVRSPDYPPAIATPLEDLERQGTLVSIARSEFLEFEGMRISGARQARSVSILSVR